MSSASGTAAHHTADGTWLVCAAAVPQVMPMPIGTEEASSPSGRYARRNGGAV